MDSGVEQGHLFERASELDTFLNLLSNPFQSQIQATSFYAALVWSFGVSSGLFFLFCLLRPRTSNIYAPRAKHADQKHKPPPVGKGFFSWIGPIRSVKENELVEKIGLDATIFLRFLRMLRNIFLVLSVIGCGVLVPVCLSNYHGVSSSPYGYGGYGNYDNYDTGSNSQTVQTFIKMTPQYLRGTPFWAFVVIAYVFNLVVFFFLWWNYRAVTRLRRMYFESADYRNSLHSRTLMITHVPDSYRTEEGIVEIVQRGKATEEYPKVAVGRSLRELPDLIEEHEEAVVKLEGHLAKYLNDPNKLPPNRPTCKPSKRDRQHKGSGKVDAIEYYTSRMQYLENAIKTVRESIDKRHPLPYGFASYTYVEDAHSVAYATRKKGPKGTVIKLAPKPTDILWKNLAMSKAARRSQQAWNGFWMVLLTILYIPPNVLISVFLVNLHQLGAVWKGFRSTLYAHPTAWSILQGILAPLINILFYLCLPMIFRRLLVRAGDTTKTSRERHVTSKLYSFIVFNNLFVFSVFGTVFGYVTVVVESQGSSVWDAIKDAHLASKIAIALCNLSPYWITWQLQRNLSTTIDILQAWPLVKNTFLKRFSNPTPRQLVELTAPQPIEYAEYYYNYLFVATVGLAFGAVQPLILPITAFYIGIEVWLKKYMVQYVFITKVESGGAFWRMLFNRILVAVLLMDGVIALLVGALGFNTIMLYAMIPLLIILPVFKWYCAASYDAKISYYTTKTYSEGETGGTTTPGAEKRLRRNQDRVGVKYGNPALYKKLMTPMVHAKSQHLLGQVYGGRFASDRDDTKYDGRPTSVFGYSDIYMGQMDNERPGKLYYGGGNVGESGLPFEMVGESEMDFENYKRRGDFRYDYGGDGELYGRPEDSSSRPTTPSSMMSFGASTLMGPMSRRTSETAVRPITQDEGEMIYPRGYNAVGPSSREASPVRISRPRDGSGSRERTYSPHGNIRQSTLSLVDIPTPGLQSGEVDAVGASAYREQSPVSKRSSRGSLGGMLENAATMAQQQQSRPGSAPMRKPVASAARVGGQQVRHGHGQSSSGGGASGFNSPQAFASPQGTPYDEDMSYDYFRRGRMQ